MRELHVPGVLRAEIRIALLECVFIDDEQEGIELLKNRAIDAAARAEREGVGRINIMTYKQGRE